MIVSLFNQIIILHKACRVFSVTIFITMNGNEPQGPFNTVCSRYPVGMQYAVGVSEKRSTHTVDLANMGGGDCYL